MMETKLRSKRIEYICYISFLVSFVLLALRAFKGFIWHDECFYLSTANRFVLGDRVLIDEWNSAQFFAILLMPLVWLYRTITGGTEGIILTFRIVYVIFSGVISVYIFTVLKRQNNLWIAFVTAILNLYYVKLGIAAFSYNTIALEMLLLSGILLYDWLEEKQKRKLVFSGITYAMATLSNPFLVMGELLIMLGVLFCGFRHREHGKNVKNAYLCHVLGILLIAIPVFVWWIKDITFYEFSISVRCILRNSSAASEKGTFHRMLSFGWQIVKLYKVTILPYTILLVLSMKYAVQKKRNPQFLSVALLLQTVILYINIFISGSGMNIGVSLIAVTMYGVNLFFLLPQNKRNGSLYWFIVGGVAAFLFFISSDTGVPSIASGCLISSIGTFICLKEIMDCVQNIEKRWQMVLKIFAFGAIAAVVVSTITFRFVYVFRDGRIEDLNYKIESGPAMGLYTRLERKQDYDLVLQAVKDYVNEEDCLLVTKLAPWAYLCTDAACGSYSTWITRYDSDVLEEYYLLFPNRIPNKILILNEEIGYKNEDNPRGGYLEKLVGEYEEKKLDCGVLLTHERF